MIAYPTLSILLFLAAILISFFRIFYPSHRHVSFLSVLLGLASGLFWLIKYTSFVAVIRDRTFLVFLGSIGLVYILYIIFPFTEVVFLKKGPDELDQEIRWGFKKVQYLNKLVAERGKELIDFYQNQMQPEELRVEKIKSFKRLYFLFLESFYELEKLTGRFRHFYQINLFRHLTLNFRAFLVAYSGFITRYTLVFQLSKILSKPAQQYLDEKIPRFGKKTYYELKKRLNHPQLAIQLNSGLLYLKYGQRNKKLFKKLSKQEQDLLIYCKKSYRNLLRSFGHTIKLSAQIPLDVLEKGSTKAIVPLQKKIAKGLAETRVSFQEQYSIPKKQITKFHALLQPGDLLLQRRNFHLSNFGIDGFWKHSALYLGTLKKMDQYFSEESKALFGSKLSLHLAEKHPKLYALKKQNAQQYPLATLEGKAEGVIMLPLEESAHADYLGALRPQLSKLDKLKALLIAFEQFGKPYDYNFDFSSSDQLVCSELIYKSYLPSENKKGLNYPLSRKAGRLMLAPNDMVKEFDVNYEHPEAEMEFIFYWEGDYNTHRATQKSLKEFRESWRRPRVDIGSPENLVEK